MPGDRPQAIQAHYTPGLAGTKTFLEVLTHPRSCGLGSIARGINRDGQDALRPAGNRLHCALSQTALIGNDSRLAPGSFLTYHGGMSCTSPSPREVMAVALAAGRAMVPPYAQCFACHKFTQRQWFVCVVGKVFEGWDYRGTEQGGKVVRRIGKVVVAGIIHPDTVSSPGPRYASSSFGCGPVPLQDAHPVAFQGDPAGDGFTGQGIGVWPVQRDHGRGLVEVGQEQEIRMSIRA